MPPPEERDLHLEEAACCPETATLPGSTCRPGRQKAKEAIIKSGKIDFKPKTVARTKKDITN